MKRIIACLALLLTLPAVAQAPATLYPRVEVETTAGTFVIEVDTVRAPLTAENFLRYVRDGFYNGLIVHRVVPNFVVQGGGFDTGYAERPTRGPIPNESGNGLQNRRGTVAMARGDSPHSATSQFYVNLVDNPGLSPLPSGISWPTATRTTRPATAHSSWRRVGCRSGRRHRVIASSRTWKPSSGCRRHHS